jgi:hypothetical protein
MEFSILAEDAELRLDLLCNIMYGLVSKNICSLTILKLRETNVTQEVIETVSGKQGVYLVQRRVATHPSYTVYRCVREENPEGQLLLKIATEPLHNGLLDREAFLLQDMRAKADDLEAEYQRERGGDPLNNHYLFPHVIETFIDKNQGHRRITISGFDIEKTLGELDPLLRIRTRVHVRIDRKTSAWVLGKALRILVFAHSLGVSVGDLRPVNLVVQKDEHLIAAFDWTRAKRYLDERVPDITAIAEIQTVAKSVLLLLTERDNRTVPPCEFDPDDRYLRHVMEITTSKEVDPLVVHARFYELIRELWGRTYHPWTTFPFQQTD